MEEEWQSKHQQHGAKRKSKRVWWGRGHMDSEGLCVEVTVDSRITETAQCRPQGSHKGKVSMRRMPGVYGNTPYTPWSVSLSHTPAAPILQRQIGPQPEEDTLMGR